MPHGPFIYFYSWTTCLIHSHRPEIMWVRPIMRVRPITYKLSDQVCFTLNTIWVPSVSAWMYLRPRGPGWRADGQCMLGAVLPGAWHPAWWTDAFGQNHWRGRWLVQHFLQWNWCWQTCTKSCVHRPWTHCCRWVRCSPADVHWTA